MIRYIIKRLLQLIPILIGITFLSFAMMRLAGGDAVTYIKEQSAMIIKNGLIHSLEKGFYPDTIYIEETRFISLLLPLLFNT